MLQEECDWRSYVVFIKVYPVLDRQIGGEVEKHDRQ